MIGLATPFITNNYGTKLQAFALHHYLEENGWDNEIINYRFGQKQFNLKKLFLPNRKEYRRINRERQEALFKQPDVKKNIDVRNKRFERFTQNSYALSERCDTLEDVNRLAEVRYSAVVCGSDQIWLPSHALEKYYLLDFLPDSVKKIAYAPSFGVSTIPGIVRSNYKKALEKFDVVTVREDTGASLIKELTGKNCPVVVDPTLLLTANQWIELLKIERPLIRGKYVLAYFIGATEEHREKARAYAKAHNLRLVILPNIDEIVKADTEYADEPLYDAGPDDFVNLIKNAEAVFTDSFHGTVFSLIFQRNIYCFERFNKTSKNSTNSRIYSLLSKTHLQSRLVRDMEADLPVDTIDYTCVLRDIDLLKVSSINILEGALKDER